MAKVLSPRALTILVLVGFLAGLIGLAARFRSESGLRTSEILLDSDALSDWQATIKDKTVADALPKRLKDAGISSLAFGELHLENLIERGIAAPMSFQEFDLALKGGGLVSPGSPNYVSAFTFNVGKWATGTPGCYLLFADSKVAESVAQTLYITIGKPDPAKRSPGIELILDNRVIFVPLSVRQLRLRSLGFDVAGIQRWVQEGGFSVWLRPEDTPGLSPEQIKALFALWNKELPGVQGVIFGGPLNQVIGYPDNLETTRDEIKALGWKVGYIELPERAQQLGIETLVRELPEKTVRVMAVPPAQQQKLSPYRTLGMYSLGARERNLRVLYVRPYANGKPEDDEDFLFALPKEVAPIGPADTFQPSPPPNLAATAVMSLGAGALAVLLLQAVGIPVNTLMTLALLVLPVLGGLAFALLGKSVLFRTLLALCVSIGGPTLAFIQFVYPSVTAEKDGRSTIKEGLRLLVLVSMFSLLTGLWVAALLPDTTFLLGLDRFKGVKLLTLGAPVLIVVAFLWKHYSKDQWLEGMMASVRVYQAALVGVLLAAFGILLLRTGNDAGAAASDSERYLRVFLDQALGVRPRFKEFLLAHPAMILTPLLAFEFGFLPTLVVVLIAAIGQAGIVDTFAHVHTPLQVTIIRVILGVAFGVLFGLLGHGVFSGIFKRFKKTSDRPTEM